MKYILKRLFRKKKYYTPKPGWNTINELQSEVYKLQTEISSLASSLDRVRVGGVYLNKKDAKKYKANHFVCH